MNICLSTIQQTDNLAHIAKETLKYLYSASDILHHFKSAIKEFMKTVKDIIWGKYKAFLHKYPKISCTLLAEKTKIHSVKCESMTLIM